MLNFAIGLIAIVAAVLIGVTGVMIHQSGFDLGSGLQWLSIGISSIGLTACIYATVRR